MGAPHYPHHREREGTVGDSQRKLERLGLSGIAALQRRDLEREAPTVPDRHRDLEREAPTVPSRPRAARKNYCPIPALTCTGSSCQYSGNTNARCRGQTSSSESPSYNRPFIIT